MPPAPAPTPDPAGGVPLPPTLTIATGSAYPSPSESVASDISMYAASLTKAEVFCAFTTKSEATTDCPWAVGHTHSAKSTIADAMMVEGFKGRKMVGMSSPLAIAVAAWRGYQTF